MIREFRNCTIPHVPDGSRWSVVVTNDGDEFVQIKEEIIKLAKEKSTTSPVYVTEAIEINSNSAMTFFRTTWDRNLVIRLLQGMRFPYPLSLN